MTDRRKIESACLHKGKTTGGISPFNGHGIMI
jgi:hypothetical protein